MPKDAESDRTPHNASLQELGPDARRRTIRPLPSQGGGPLCSRPLPGNERNEPPLKRLLQRDEPALPVVRVSLSQKVWGSSGNACG